MVMSSTNNHIYAKFQKNGRYKPAIPHGTMKISAIIITPVYRFFNSCCGKASQILLSRNKIPKEVIMIPINSKNSNSQSKTTVPIVTKISPTAVINKNIF